MPSTLKVFVSEGTGVRLLLSSFLSNYIFSVIGVVVVVELLVVVCWQCGLVDEVSD